MSHDRYSDKLYRTNNNMDTIRYILSLSVIIYHFNYLCGKNINWFINIDIAVGCFFALSGFLVYRSFERSNNVRTYFSRRAKRILPPYILIILLCGVGLVSVSSYSLSDYFTDNGFWKYLISNLTFMNFIHPNLPGVFDSNQFISTAVNGSLWTIKVEWLLYASVPVAVWLCRVLSKKTKHPRPIMLCFIIISSVFYNFIFHFLYTSTGKEIYEILGRQVCGQLDYFYFGIAVYLYFDFFMDNRIPISIISIILIACQDIIPFYKILIEPFAATSIMLVFCFTGKWGCFSKHDNVSYDMYLYHWPILQLAVWTNISEMSTAQAFTISFAVIILFSILSWNIIGKRFLKKT